MEAAIAIEAEDTPTAAPDPPELSLGVLQRAKAGEEAACRAFLARYRTMVGALLHRMLSTAGLQSLVEDLAQETFLRAFRALPRFDPEGPARLSTWLLRIAARLAINELKRRRPRVVPTQPDALAGSRSADFEHRRKRLAEAIQRAVAELPPEFRAAFLLREYHGREYAEIAMMLGIEVGTVKSRLGRARARLREALEEVRDA